MFSLLMIEDDVAISEMLTLFLTSKSYQVTLAATGKQALICLNQSKPDVILLDWMLPDLDGITLIQKIRSLPLHSHIPILMLTAKATQADKIKGLNTGADDYMTKPVSLQELDARIRALIRRSQGLNEEQCCEYGGIVLDPQQKIVKINQQLVKMSHKEYKLLSFLMQNPERLYSRAQLLDNVWGQTVYLEERTVDVHVMRLRKILKKYQCDFLLQTIRGSGYRFSTSSQ